MSTDRQSELDLARSLVDVHDYDVDRNKLFLRDRQRDAQEGVERFALASASDEWNWAWNTSMMKLKIKTHDVGTALSRNCAAVKMYLHFRSQLFFN